MKELIAIAFSVVALISGAFLTVNMPKEQTPPLGATPGNEFQQRADFLGGTLNGGIVSTTSLATATTLKAAELRGWVNSSIVSYVPIGVARNTITFPASSTISDIVPRPGDKQSFCFRNATSTADLHVIFAGATGVNLNVASSSATAVGSPNVTSGENACFTLIRQAATATTYDIDVLMTAFK